MKRNSYYYIFLAFCSFIATAQQDDAAYVIKSTQGQFKIDGVAEEPEWATAMTGGDFWQYRPVDSIKAIKQTEFKILNSGKELYVLIKAYHDSQTFVTNSLKRDFSGWGIDSVTMYFDTFSDATNAFLFAIDPNGVQTEGLVANGNNNFRRDRNYTWDVKWETASKMYEDYYLMEARIPLDFINFPKGADSWRFSINRNNTYTNEYTSWIRVPQNQSPSSLAFMRTVRFEDPLGSPKRPVSIIPFINSISNFDLENNTDNYNFTYGADAKVPIGNGLNLDLTVNPDFSQVEVDDQIVNLTRFEISLPEKRQFFTQNRDLFSSFGETRDAVPFFSRRIGVAQDIDGNTIQNKIIGGARLSGKLNESLRLGFLNMITDRDVDNEIASYSNTVFTLQQRVFDRSNISAFFINRNTTDDYDFLNGTLKNNNVFGVEYNLASKSNVWTGKTFIHKSNSLEKEKDYSAGFVLQRNTRKNRFGIKNVYVGDNFESQLGFYRRIGFNKFEPSYTYRIFPRKNAIVNRYEFRQRQIYVYNSFLDWEVSDRWSLTSFEIRFQNQSNLEFQTTDRKIYLFEDFDPSRSGNGLSLPGENEYRYRDYEINYRSDPRKDFSLSLRSSFGPFYTGEKISIRNEITFRKQPFLNASLLINYNDIRLPEPFASGTLWLIAPKVEYTFTKNLFWTTLTQFNSQSESFGINSRLQWRFAPLSDLFLVYNDNYFTTDGLIPRLRSINLKLTYWLNI